MTTHREKLIRLFPLIGLNLEGAIMHMRDVTLSTFKAIFEEDTHETEPNKTAIALLDTTLNERIGELRESLIATYEVAFPNEQDVDALLVFYASDLGKRTVKANLDVGKQLNSIGTDWQTSIMESIGERLAQILDVKADLTLGDNRH